MARALYLVLYVVAIVGGLAVVNAVYDSQGLLAAVGAFVVIVLVMVIVTRLIVLTYAGSEDPS